MPCSRISLGSLTAWRRPLSKSGLPDATADFLSATNHNFVQEGSLLYVAGGYGWSRSAVDYVTFSHFARIDVSALIHWVKHEPGSPSPSQSIQTIQAPLFQVTGGALEKPGAHFLLVFGQNYPGRYRPNFNGTYTNKSGASPSRPGPLSNWIPPPSPAVRRLRTTGGAI